MELLRNWDIKIGSPIHSTMSSFVSECVSEQKFTPNIKRACMVNSFVGIISEPDFINKSCYKGFTKLFKCNSEKPKYTKRYMGKSWGLANIIGFKLTDYDQSRNVLIFDNVNFMFLIKGKMIEEFPEYPSHLYLYDEFPDEYEYNRDWENIKGLTPQEKIVLANIHNEEAFPHSYYENDRGLFQKRVLQDEFNTRLESELAEISDIRDYEAKEDEDIFEIMDKTILEREASFINGVKEGFDYGDFQDFSDIYTRTSTAYEDYELYPVRVNCTPKSVRKKGKSPYDTKLGVRSFRYFDYYQKPKPLVGWISKKSPKYNCEMNEEEKLDVEYNLPEDFWEEIEMAYQQR